ncbi:MAG: hypothetical protein IJN58_06205 [Clostridia bacterium]|nr:hypothetical protein [Clostridia bacterium]
MPSFPRTEVGGISLPRMHIGSNWINGYSHTSPASDKMIRSYHNSPERIAELLEAYLEYDINAIMALFKDNPQLLEGIKIAEERTGKKIIRIDTPTMNVADTAEARREALETVRYSKEVVGADFCLIHHSSAEQLVNKGKGTIERLPDYLYMIREAGMHPGLSAHMPELVLYSDANEYDVDTYIQIYNCMGFLMQVEVEYINQVIWNAKKPVMTIKSMAAGRCSPFVGITFSYNTIRPCDMVTMGAFNPDEVHEDVEIALAAIEHRRANIGGRATPNKTAALGGKVK